MVGISWLILFVFIVVIQSLTTVLDSCRPWDTNNVFLCHSYIHFKYFFLSLSFIEFKKSFWQCQLVTVMRLVVSNLYCTVLYCTVLYCTVLCCTVLYCTVLYCTVLYGYLSKAKCLIDLLTGLSRLGLVWSRGLGTRTWELQILTGVIFTWILFHQRAPFQINRILFGATIYFIEGPHILSATIRPLSETSNEFKMSLMLRLASLR